MPDNAPPCYTVRIAPELVQVFRDLATMQTHELAQGGAGDCPPARIDPIWEHVALRQDGKRPLRAEAMLVTIFEDAPCISFANQEIAVARSTSIYITREGEVFAQVRCTPPAGMPARPVCSVVKPATADELLSHMARTGPQTCFAVSAQHAELSGSALMVPLGKSGQGRYSATSQ